MTLADGIYDSRSAVIFFLLLPRFKLRFKSLILSIFDLFFETKIRSKGVSVRQGQVLCCDVKCDCHADHIIILYDGSKGQWQVHVLRTYSEVPQVLYMSELLLFLSH